MRTWNCTLEVTTPMALAGVNQQRAELRPNTFKNRLRWWWRAGRGRLNREKEAWLFGDVESEAAGAQSGRFRPRLYPRNQEAEESILFDQFLRREGLLNDDGNHRLDGLGYLGHYLDPSGHDNPPRGVLRPGARFRATLRFPLWFDEVERREVWASLWLLVWFGGLGTRSRRGFGGLNVVDSNPTGDLQFSFSGGSPDQLRSFLEENLQRARRWLGGPVREEQPDLPEYTALVPGWTRIFVEDPLINSTNDHREYNYSRAPGWAKALDVAGGDLKAHRKELRTAYDEVACFLEEENYTPDTVDRAAFGLPLTFWYPPIQEAEGSRLRATAEVGQHQRRASPLFVRAHQTDDEYEMYALVYVLMKARLLPEGEQIEVSCEARQRQEEVPQPDFSRVDKFFDKDEDELDVFEEPGPKDHFLPVSLQPSPSE
jgi:hypothetical protein